MADLKEARKKIDEIDAQMKNLFEARMSAVEEVAAYKKDHGLPIKDAAREQEILSSSANSEARQDVDSYYVQFKKNLINLSCDYQRRLNEGLRIAYSGVEGAFAYIAAKKMFPEASLVAYSDFTNAYKAVEAGDLDCVVLPLENSYAGEVGTVMDLMFSGSLYVNQVIDIEIEHNLMACPGATLADIKEVVSHEQALAQCDEYLVQHNFKVTSFPNTAMAAKYVKEQNNKEIAAIASDETANIFGLEVLDARINASRNNTTRFGVFSRAQNKPLPTSKREDEAFILVFTVRNEAGSLAQTLNIIGAHGFNMKSLRSRPMKGLEWNYFFYIEAEGNINTQNGQSLLQELNAVCAQLKLVGTYCAGN